MKIDSTALMYCAFQSCRELSPDAAAYLGVLVPVLEAVRRERTFVVELDDELGAQILALDMYAWASADVYWPHGAAVAPAHSQMLTMIDAGVRDLQRLVTSGLSDAVAALGYALHPLPSLLRQPDDFESGQYAFCLAVTAKHWRDLSGEMRDAFRKLVGPELADAVLRRAGQHTAAP
ncbi:MAG TPA: hypothetical protein VIM73_17295 [Polyangiaceae bacterium]